MLKFFLAFSFALFLFLEPTYPAPCYGPRMPKKGEIFAGVQTHLIFKRHLENEFGKVRSSQYFFQFSYGLYDWLAIDLKAGCGNIKQHPVSSDEVDYTSSFAGGYGFRLKLYDNQKTKLVFGFQHISVHPKYIHLNDVKNKAILDDWQVSLLASYDFLENTSLEKKSLKKFIPYLGLKWSRVDYIHWVEEDRKRKMSDLTKDIGLVLGLDFPISTKIWLNIEGQFFDTEAFATSFNFKF